MARLTAEFWVTAYLRRLDLAGIPAYLRQRGAAEAGAVLILARRAGGDHAAYERRADGGWLCAAEGAESAVEAFAARARSRDPDLWVIEVDDPLGRHLLAEEGLDRAE